MTYILWDGKSPINGKSADWIIHNNPDFGVGNVAVFLDNGGYVTAAPVSYMPAGDTFDARCAAYIAQSTPHTPTAAEIRVDELKQLLVGTDYQAIKYAEGWITAEDYAMMKAQRQAWRDEINRLEGNV